MTLGYQKSKWNLSKQFGVSSFGMTRTGIFALFTLSLFLQACGVPAGDTKLTPNSSTIQPILASETPTSRLIAPTPDYVGTMPANVTPQSTASDRQVALAVQDLAYRLSVPEDRITVLLVQPVTWPDAGLGCPSPGMRYPQVPEDGILIRLEAGGQIYDYHAGGLRDPFLCPPTPAPKATSPGLERFITPPAP